MDVLVAYYCFVNLGWAPSQYDNLSPEDHALVKMFALRSMDENRRLQDKAKG